MAGRPFVCSFHAIYLRSALLVVDDVAEALGELGSEIGVVSPGLGRRARQSEQVCAARGHYVEIVLLPLAYRDLQAGGGGGKHLTMYNGRPWPATSASLGSDVMATIAEGAALGLRGKVVSQGGSQPSRFSSMRACDRRPDCNSARRGLVTGVLIVIQLDVGW